MREFADTKFQENGQRDQKILLLNEVWTQNQVSLNKRKSTQQKPRKIRDQTNNDTKSEMTLKRVTKRQYSTVRVCDLNPPLRSYVKAGFIMRWKNGGEALPTELVKPDPILHGRTCWIRITEKIVIFLHEKSWFSLLKRSSVIHNEPVQQGRAWNWNVMWGASNVPLTTNHGRGLLGRIDGILKRHFLFT